MNLREKPQYGLALKKISHRSSRDWTDRANERNLKESKDSTVVWRVRGSPSKSLYLKKYQKHQK